MRVRNIIVGLVVVATSLGFLLAGVSGLKWFTVETPSMGQAAPRGSLVVTEPVAFNQLVVGDIISFHPPTSPTQTYTHRIAAITANGVVTKGDINGSVDGWNLHSKDLIGRATLILPAAGWLLKILPLLGVGLLLVWALSLLVPNRQARGSLRLFGSSMVFTYAITMVRPFSNFEVVDSLPSPLGKNQVDYTVVNTGILPMAFKSSDGSSIVLNDGQVGVVHATVNPSANFVDLGAHLSLQPWQMVTFGFIGAIPLMISILHFLKSRRVVPSELASQA